MIIQINMNIKSFQDKNYTETNYCCKGIYKKLSNKKTITFQEQNESYMISVSENIIELMRKGTETSHIYLSEDGNSKATYISQYGKLDLDISYIQSEIKDNLWKIKYKLLNSSDEETIFETTINFNKIID